jgi:hypothetical protein
MKLSPDDKLVEQMQRKLDNMQRFIDVILGLQATFMGHWVRTAHLLDSEQHRLSVVLSQLENYLRDADRGSSAAQELS